MLAQTIKYAIQCHRETNHEYDGMPYEFHLKMVADTAEEFIELIPEHARETVLAACWVHDCIEDCRQTYNDVKEATNEQIAELAYALTNEKGKTRAERANDKYYEGIRNTPYASFIKACDRIANVKHSRDKGNPRMLKIYTGENPKFVAKIYHSAYQPLYDRLESLLEA